MQLTPAATLSDLTNQLDLLGYNYIRTNKSRIDIRTEGLAESKSVADMVRNFIGAGTSFDIAIVSPSMVKVGL